MLARPRRAGFASLGLGVGLRIGHGDCRRHISILCACCHNAETICPASPYSEQFASSPSGSLPVRCPRTRKEGPGRSRRFIGRDMRPRKTLAVSGTGCEAIPLPVDKTRNPAMKLRRAHLGANKVKARTSLCVQTICAYPTTIRTVCQWPLVIPNPHIRWRPGWQVVHRWLCGGAGRSKPGREPVRVVVGSCGPAGAVRVWPEGNTYPPATRQRIRVSPCIYLGGLPGRRPQSSEPRPNDFLQQLPEDPHQHLPGVMDHLAHVVEDREA